MTDTAAITVEEARRIVEEAEEETGPYRPPRAEVADYHARLLRENPEASSAQIHDALHRWVDEQTEERRARAEREAAGREKQARETACKMCRTPGQQLAYVGVTERERLHGHKHGFVDYFCERCRPALAAEWAQALAAETVDGKTRAELSREYLAGRLARQRKDLNGPGPNP